MIWKAKAEPIDPETLSRDDLITVTQAVRMIEPADRRSDDMHTEQAVDRIESRIRYAIKAGKLRRDSTGHLVFGELAAWAQDTYRGKFTDWPAIRLSTGKAEITLDGVTSQLVGVLIPPDLSGCQKRIKALTEEVAALHQANAALHREVDELRPYKAHYEELSQKNRESAKKSRPRTK